MNCICGKRLAIPLFRSGLYDVIKCKACGQVRIEARRGAKRTGYYEEEDVKFYLDHQDMFRRIFREKLAFIQRYAPRGTMLDVGAGVGLFLNEARKTGYNVIGFEPSKASVRAAKKHFGIDLINSEFHKATPSKKLRGGLENIDIVVLNHVLEHLKNPTEIIALCSQILKNLRTLVIGVPNFDSFMSGIKRGKWQSLIPEQHRWQFTLKTLDQLVIPHGFRRIAVSYENHDRSMHYWWKRPIYWTLDRIALMTGYAEAMLVIYKKI